MFACSARWSPPPSPLLFQLARTLVAGSVELESALPAGGDREGAVVGLVVMSLAEVVLEP